MKTVIYLYDFFLLQNIKEDVCVCVILFNVMLF